MEPMRLRTTTISYRTLRPEGATQTTIKEYHSEMERMNTKQKERGTPKAPKGMNRTEQFMCDWGMI
jgi:hypothetical protein